MKLLFLQLKPNSHTYSFNVMVFQRTDKGGNHPYRVIIGSQHLNRMSDLRNLSFSVFSEYYI